jgi:hypothetical protein
MDREVKSFKSIVLSQVSSLLDTPVPCVISTPTRDQYHKLLEYFQATGHIHLGVQAREEGRSIILNHQRYKWCSIDCPLCTHRNCGVHNHNFYVLVEDAHLNTSIDIDTDYVEDRLRDIFAEDME